MVSRLTLAIVLVGTAWPVAAKTYCCKDPSGHLVCGDILPAQCLSRGYQEYNSQGIVSKEVDAPLTPEQRAQKKAEEARLKEEQRKVAEQQRQDRALLASYTNVKDIEAKRDRTVADLQASLHLAEERHADALARLGQLQGHAAKSAQTPIPEPLRLRIRQAENEVAAQQYTIDGRKHDILEVQERFERDRQRFLALTQQQTESATGAKPTAPASSSAAH